MSEKKKKKTAALQGKQESSRREFLTSSGSVLLGATVAGCAARKATPAPAATMTAASAGRVIGANDRIRVGFIGTGGMGTFQVRSVIGHPPREGSTRAPDEPLSKLANVEVAGVCDVYEPWRERAAELTKAKAYVDYRELLASGDVDCVVIATPEHWHCQMALDSLAAGMDVYLQKPMTRTYEEALRLKNAFSKSDRVFQLGSQYCQRPAWWKARELYEAGHLGKVVMSQTSYHRNSRDGEWNYDILDTEPGRNLDWDRWLGPLGPMDYDPEYFFRWRKYERFSGGIITDLLPHKIHSILYILGAGDLPKQVTCVGGIYVHPDRTVADTCVMTVDYGDSVMIVSGATCNERGLENMVRGHHATLHIGENSVRVAPERPFADEMDPIDARVPPAGMETTAYHMKEFFDCMRTRTQPTWDVESTYNVMTAIAMAETAYKEKRTVHFDAEHGRVV